MAEQDGGAAFVSAAGVSNNGRSRSIPEPYSAWWHPHKCMLDIICGFLVCLFAIDLVSFTRVSPLLLPASHARSGRYDGTEQDSYGRSEDKEEQQQQQQQQQQHNREETDFSSASTDPLLHQSDTPSPYVNRNHQLKVARKRLADIGSAGLPQSLRKCARPFLDDRLQSLGVPPLVRTAWSIPVQHSVLYDWNVLDRRRHGTSVLPPQQHERSHVNLIVHCPVAAFTQYGQRRLIDAQNDDCSSESVMNVKSDLLVALLKNELEHPDLTPFVLHCHGGALVMGSATDSVAFQYIAALYDLQAKALNDDTKQLRPIVLMSVEYRLAPEHPFPACHVDTFTALDAIVRHLLPSPKARLHLHGVSAGGYVAWVLAAETMRAAVALDDGIPDHTVRHIRACASHIASVNCVAPMLNPSANSVSYYMNSKSAMVCPVGFLRWSWRAFLQLPQVEESNASDEVSNVLNANSNYDAWKASPMYKDKVLRRLCDPLADLPLDAVYKYRVPIFVSTNRADALLDDGKELYKKLADDETARNGTGSPSKLNYFEHRGSHILGFQLDKDATADRLAGYAEVLFGDAVER